MPARADFHCHSTASDGVHAPAAVVKLAYEQGVRVLALTDHDSTEGVAEARKAAEAYPDLTLIPGVELGTDIPGGEVHVVGLFLEPDDPELGATLKRLREGRLGRGEGIVKKLQELGFTDVTWEQVQRIADGASVGRPHIAQALLENGHVETVKEAFDKYIARNGPAYVEREKMTPAEAVSTIKRLGGVASLAHPAELDLDELLPALKAAGLAAMEVFYKDYEPETVERLLQTARKFDIIPLGGSDYHGIFGQEEPLPGRMRSDLPEESIQAVLALGNAT